jgi:chromate transporter
MELLTLFFEFFKIGAFTFGGGYAMIPMIRQAVAAHGWATDAEIVNFIAISESTPGPFAINCATFVGMRNAGILGSAAATLGVVLPSFIIILLISRFFMSFKDNSLVKGGLSGIRPAVIGLICAAGAQVLISNIFGAKTLPDLIKVGSIDWLSLCISAAVFALSLVKIKKKRVHPILLIALSAALGIIFFGIL